MAYIPNMGVVQLCLPKLQSTMTLLSFNETALHIPKGIYLITLIGLIEMIQVHN